MSFLRSPLGSAARNLQRRQLLARAGRAESLAWGVLPRSMSVVSAVRSGLLAFGMPIEGRRLT